MNTHIEDINNLFSHNNITKDKVDIVTQIGNVFELYRSEDIENLIKLLTDSCKLVFDRYVKKSSLSFSGNCM